MPSAVDIKELLKLSADQRSAIVDALLASLEGEGPAPGPSEADLKQRLKEYHANPDQRLLSTDDVRRAVGWSN